jgi:hypothetical protein
VITCVMKTRKYVCKICGLEKVGTLNQVVCGGPCYRKWAMIRAGKTKLRNKAAIAATNRRVERVQRKMDKEI